MSISTTMSHLISKETRNPVNIGDSVMINHVPWKFLDLLHNPEDNSIELLVQKDGRTRKYSLDATKLEFVQETD